MTLALAALLLCDLPAPLAAQLRAAAQHNRTLLISRAQLAGQQAQVEQAVAALVPSFQANGGYTRNQYQGAITVPSFAAVTGGLGPGGLASLPTTTIVTQPYDQLQGTLALNIPLVEPGAVARYAQGRHAADAAAKSEAASELEVQLSVARAYYQVVAAQGVLAAAGRSLETAQDALAISKAKQEAGTANQLTVDKAQVDVARGRQTVAEAQRTLGVARRSLETLSGLPLPGDLPPATAEPAAQAEESYLEAARAERPELAQAQAAIDQASAARDEAWTQLAPTLTGQAAEHLQNYSGFIYHEGFWTLGVNLAWTVDPAGTRAALHKAEASLAEQRARLAQALDQVSDEVHSAWLDTVADGARAAETRAEAASASEALGLTKEQFKAGTATSLDLSQAERDAFSAEANNAQAESDLATALLALQKAAGRPLLEASR